MPSRSTIMGKIFEIDRENLLQKQIYEIDGENLDS
jgi:hypothetical protein